MSMEPNLQLIVGPSGCGKTWLLLNSILGKEAQRDGEFDYIFVLAPTIFINKIYIEWASR